MSKQSKYQLGLGATLVIALLYVLLPADLVPDAVPALGWIDDIIAVLLAIANAIRLGAKIRKSKDKD